MSQREESRSPSPVPIQAHYHSRLASSSSSSSWDNTQQDEESLLRGGVPGGSDGASEGTEAVARVTTCPRRGRPFWRELRKLMLLAWPITLSNLLSSTLSIVDLVFVGRVGSTEIAAAALANTWTTITMFLGIGLCSAMDTLVSQSFGARNFSSIGILVQRGAILMALMSIPLSLMWWWTEPIMLVLGQDPLISDLTAQFSRVLIPGLLPFLVLQAILRYMQGQGIMWISLVSNLVANLFNIALNFLFVWGAGDWNGMGFLGVAVSTSISRYIMVIVAWGCIVCRGLHKKTWTGWNLRAAMNWTGVKQFLKLGVPGAAMTCLEVWGFELTTLAAGLLGEASLAAHTCILQVIVTTFMIPFGISIAVSTRVGYLLGKGSAKGGKRIVLVSYVLTGAIMLTLGTILMIFKTSIGFIFTSDEAIVGLVSQVIPVVALFQFFDGTQAVFGGVLRGMGHQIVGAFFNLMAFYVVNIPLGILLTFVAHQGIIGLWIGLAVALFLVSTSLLIRLLLVDWDKEVKKAADRMAADHVEYRQQLSDGGVEMEEMAAHTTFGQEEEESLERGGAAPLQLVLSSGSREREEKDPEQGPDSHSTQNT